jgi:DNA-binding protein HU-beta
VPNKAQFVEALAERFDGDKKRAAAALDAVIDTLYSAISRGEKVALTGFGIFERRERAARMARNPATGAAVRVKKTAVPAFRAGAEFKAIASGARKLAGNEARKAAAAVEKATGPAKKAAAAAVGRATPSRNAPAKKSAAKKAPAKKAPAKKASASKAPAKKAPAKKATASKSTASKSTAKKAPAKKATR